MRRYKDEQKEALAQPAVAEQHKQRSEASTWVGLEPEDRLCAKYMQDAPDGIEAVIDYIVAKLKQKNGYTEEKNNGS